MKYEELTQRKTYDREHRWICSNCKSDLDNASIRWGNWKNDKGQHRDLSRCCNASIIPRI